MLVGREYLQMLVVKAVELIVAKDNHGPAAGCSAFAAPWLEKCNVTKLVDIFWHASTLQVSGRL
jgi:hypothetical protein